MAALASDSSPKVSCNSDNANEAFKITTSLDVIDAHDYDKNITRRDNGYFIDERLLNTIFNNPKIFKERFEETSFNYFLAIFNQIHRR